jgi:hypothetical protein
MIAAAPAAQRAGLGRPDGDAVALADAEVGGEGLDRVDPVVVFTAALRVTLVVEHRPVLHDLV